MKEINKAHEVLSDTGKRANYDRRRTERPENPIWTGEFLIPLPNAPCCSSEFRFQYLTTRRARVTIPLGQFPAATEKNIRQFVNGSLKKLTSHYARAQKAQLAISKANGTNKPMRYDILLDSITQVVNDPVLCERSTHVNNSLVRLLNIAQTSKHTGAQEILSEGAQTPIVDLSCLPIDSLHFLLGIFTDVSSTTSGFHNLKKEELLERLLEFVPRVYVQQVPAAKEQEKCGTCHQKLGFFRRKSVLCCACGRIQCSSCPLYGTKVPRLGHMTPQRICKHCANDLSRKDSDAWIQMAIDLLTEGTTEKVTAAFGCSMIALAYPDISASKLFLRLARELVNQGVPELALPFIATVRTQTREQSIETLKMHLLGASALKSMAEQEDQSWNDMFALLLASKHACLEAAAVHATLEASTDVPQLHAKAEEVDSALRQLTQKLEKHADSTVKETLALLQEAWRSRKCEDLLEIVTAPRDHALMAVTNNRDTTMEALQQFVTSIERFLPKMLPEDHSALIFFQGLLHLHNRHYTECSKDLETVAWSGHHSGWARKAVVDVLLSSDTESPESLLPHYQLITACEALAKSPSTGFKVTDVKHLSPFLPISGEKLKPPSEIHWPSLCVEGLNQVAHAKYEEAVEHQVQEGKWNNTQAAFAYIDLIPACEHPAEMAVCFLTASLWFMEEIRKVTRGRVSTSEVHALKTLTLTFLRHALAVAQLSLHPGMRMYVTRIAFQVALEATDYAGNLSTTEDSQLVLDLLNALAYSCRFWNPPMVRVSEAVLLNIITGRLHSEFILGLQHVRPELSPVTVPELHYQLYENDLRFVRALQDPANTHKKAMQEMLKERGWTFADVSNLMTSPLSPRTSDGWLKQRQTLGVSMKYAEVKGFVVDLDADSPSVQLQVEPADRYSRKVGLFSRSDVDTVLHLNPDDLFPLFFSLDPPSSMEHFHPFQEFRYQPDSLQGTSLLHTLFETDYLLKSFSIGIDVSAKPPFNQRPCQDGLTRNLPPELQAILKPVKDRGYSRNRMHRFWIQADKLTYDVTQSDSKVTYLLGPVKMVVRSHPLLLGPDGKLIDTSKDDDPNSPEAKFAEDLTKNYDLISQYFPMFARLRELCKLQFLGIVIASQLKNLEESARGEGISVPDHMVCEIQRKELQEKKGKLRSVLSDMKRQIGSWPSVNDPSEISRARQIIESNLPSDIPRWQISMFDSEIDSAVQRLLQQKDASTLSQVVDALMELSQRRVSRSTLESYVRRWLSNGSHNSYFDRSEDELVDFVAASFPVTTRHDIMQVLLEFAKQRHASFRREISNLRSAAAKTIQATTAASRMSSCKWVPAALRKEVYNGGASMTLCYGGVLLAPKIERGYVPHVNASNTRNVRLQVERQPKQTTRVPPQHSLPQISTRPSSPQDSVHCTTWSHVFQKPNGLTSPLLATLQQLFESTKNSILRSRSPTLGMPNPLGLTGSEGPSSTGCTAVVQKTTKTDIIRSKRMAKFYRHLHGIRGRETHASHTIPLQIILHSAMDQEIDIGAVAEWANGVWNFEAVPAQVNLSTHKRIDNALERKSQNGETLTTEEEERARTQARLFKENMENCPQCLRPHVQRFFESLHTVDGTSVWNTDY